MKVFGWLLVALLFFSAVYEGFMTIWSYMEMTSVVERAADMTSHMTDDRPGHVKQLVLSGAAESGLTLDDRLVTVTERDHVITVQVRWRYPVVVWNGEPVLAVPLSVERTYGLAIIR